MAPSVAKRYKKAQSKFATLTAEKVKKYLEFDSDLREILESLEFREAISVPISSATFEQVQQVTGVDIAKACDPWLDDANSQWDLDSINELDPFEPTDVFVQQFKRYQKYFGGWSEAAARSRIDVFLAEAFEHCPQVADSRTPLKFFGEVSVEMTSPKGDLRLTGSGDYFLAYGEKSLGPLRPENVTLVVEAKNGGAGGAKGLCQLLTYLAVLHRARVAAQKQAPVVFGILTTSQSWTFCYIDASGHARRTVAVEGNVQSVLRSLVFVLSAAMFTSSLTTPFASEDLLAASGVGSIRNIVGYQPVFKAGKEPRKVSDLEIVLAAKDEEESDDDDD